MYGLKKNKKKNGIVGNSCKETLKKNLAVLTCKLSKKTIWR